MNEHEGHRARLRAKLDTDALQEHEYLELLLYTAIPRRNTNDIAHRLLAEFGSISGIFSASYEQLQQVKGVGSNVAGFLSVLGDLIENLYGQGGEGYRGKYEPERFIAFLKRYYKDESNEMVQVYFLDEEKCVVGHKDFCCGDVDWAEFEPIAFTKLLLEFQPAGIVLVHNHPQGESRPSQTDEETTRKCQMICSYHNILLCDHLICSLKGVYSYLLDKRLDEISKQYSVRNLTKE